MPSDSSQVDQALFARLNGDAALMAAMAGGVHFDVGPKGGTAFVLVSQLAHEEAEMAQGTSWEQFLYLVKAVTKAPTGTTASTAAQRIQTLLHGQTLTASGYTTMKVDRLERVRYTEVDDVDQDTRWHHRGGHYVVLVSPD